MQSSDSREQTHQISDIVLATAGHSASMLDRATHVCFFADHEMGVAPRHMM